MIRGLYTSAMGMQNNEKRMEVISNNLANIDTTGYKKDTAVSTSFAEVMTEIINSDQDDNQNDVGKLSLGVGVDDVVTNYKQGSLVKTENPLDVAITNSELAFFAVEVPGANGAQEMYTRDGGFTVNSLGQLTTKDGYLVKGENGVITLNGSKVNINEDGSVIEDGSSVDKLLIKEFADSSRLNKQGNNLISNTGDTQTKPFSGQVVQGSLESSNVNSISEMVEMISVMRSYEANQKVLKSHDDTLQKAVNEVGRV